MDDFSHGLCPPKPIKEKPTCAEASVGEGGERGIRTPGPVTVNGFQDRRIRPLCHLSGAKIRLQTFQSKLICFTL
jgi:hypothetical protein